MKPAPIPSIDVRPAHVKALDERWYVLRRHEDRSWRRVYGPKTFEQAKRARDAFEKRYPQYEYAMVGEKRERL